MSKLSTFFAAAAASCLLAFSADAMAMPMGPGPVMTPSMQVGQFSAAKGRVLQHLHWRKMQINRKENCVYNADNFAQLHACMRSPMHPAGRWQHHAWQHPMPMQPMQHNNW